MSIAININEIIIFLMPSKTGKFLKRKNLQEVTNGLTKTLSLSFALLYIKV